MLFRSFTIDYSSVFVSDEWDKDYSLKIEYNKDKWDDNGFLIWNEVWKGE